ncbi:MAG: hypothetical protein JST79_01055 [Acidobacteria bacterium]|jgi:hypothetical protein|nr:hypothetical protein [Acidobacteriota bacterium]
MRYETAKWIHAVDLPTPQRRNLQFEAPLSSEFQAEHSPHFRWDRILGFTTALLFSGLVWYGLVLVLEEIFR